MTLRLPDRVAKQLRERSKAKGHSLNEIAVRALDRGLQQPDDDDEWWRALGDMVVRPPIGKFDPEELKRLHAALPKTDTSIDDTLNWMRQDRDR